MSIIAEDTVTKTDLIEGLNVDLANEYGAVIMYTTYAASVNGLNYQILKPFFEKEIPDEQGHAQYLSDKIVTLGGKPTTAAAEVRYLDDVRDMLQEAHRAESDTIRRYEKRREQANTLGMTELAITLEDLIQDETSHMEEIERLLKDPRLS